MKRLFLLLSLLVSSYASAQFTTTTGTILYPDGQAFANGTVEAAFLPINGNISVQTYKLNGAAFPYVVDGNMDGSGHFSLSLADDHIVSPQGGQWKFTVCSQANIPCSISVQDVFGPSIDLSSLINAAIVISTGNSFNFPKYYTDAEASANLGPGIAYYNLVTGFLRYYNGVSWAAIGSGGGGGVTSLNGLTGTLNIVAGTNISVVAGGSSITINNTASSTIPTGVANGSHLVSNGISQPPIYLTDVPIDARRAGFAQDGTTDDSTAASNFLSTVGNTPTTLMFTGPSLQESLTYPPNVQLKFTGMGALKPISSSTPIGGAGFVQSIGNSNVNTLTSSCSVTLSGTTAGNSIVFMEIHFFTGATIPFGAVIDTQGGHYTQLVQQGFNLPEVSSGWGRANITGGNVTITVPYKNGSNVPVNVANGCMAYEISGMGPVFAAETAGSGEETTPGTIVMSALGQYGSPTNIPTSTGSLIIGFGGNLYLNQASCTPGAGYTQPAGSGGYISGGSQPITGQGFNMCSLYRLTSPGGNVNPTQTIVVDPFVASGGTRGWTYSVISLIPSSAVINIQGPIDAPAQQIFTNALPGQGTIDFTGNTIIPEVYGEWWGASPQQSPSTNAAAMQAAVTAAYGNNRINGSQVNVYNRKFSLLGTYNISGVINAIDMNGFNFECVQRFACGFNQTATNTSILNVTTGGTDGVFRNVGFSTSASQDLNHPLVSLDYTGLPRPDLRPQFIDFEYNNWYGANQAKIGLQIAKSGGGAQGSNIYFYDNEGNGFTEAAHMYGNGSGCVPTTLATNALAIEYFGGDFQGNNAYAIEWFGAGAFAVHGTSFENGYGANSNEGFQTGYDICGQSGAAGNRFVVDNVRTESLFLTGGPGPYSLRDSYNLDQCFVLPPSSTPIVNTIMQGSATAGHGKCRQVTNGGTWTGIGSPTNPIIATSGTSTTLTNTNQTFTGTNTIKIFTKLETVTQATTGSTAVILNVPISIGTITGSLTSGTINGSDILTQATTGVTCISESNLPGASTNLLVQGCSGSPDNSHIYTDGTTGGTYTPTSTPTFGTASPVAVVTLPTGSPDGTHIWTGSTSGATITPSSIPTNTANYTVNAWVGWYLSLVGIFQGYSPSNTGNLEYCVITANTAQSFTCSGGWLTDFPAYIPIVNPDDTTFYIVEPQWDVQTNNNGVTWSDITKKTSVCNAYNVFIAGTQIQLCGTPLLNGFQVTRGDWFGTAGVDGPSASIWGTPIVAGIPSGGPGQGTGILQSGPYRSQKFTRNGIVETAYPIRQEMGAAVEHYYTGTLGGGTSYGDTYFGLDSNIGAGVKSGRQFLENNSSGTAFYWYFNANGSTTIPATTGTSPFVIGSTTPVSNLTAVPTTYNAAGTQQINTHVVEDTGTLVSGTPSTATITLAGSAVFTSNTSYKCTVTNSTTPANGLGIAYTDGSHFVVTGPNTVTDSFSFHCVGN